MIFLFLGSPCEHDGICVNTPGSFACNCSQGFTGPRCETNVNECESHPCQNEGSCLDDPGTFRCVCMPGFTGTQCEIDINECGPNPCLNGGTCTDMVNGFRCTCANGFTGFRCQINIDDCMSDPCKNGGYCEDSIGGYRCQCLAGYTGNVPNSPHRFWRLNIRELFAVEYYWFFYLNKNVDLIAFARHFCCSNFFRKRYGYVLNIRCRSIITSA